MPPKRKLPEGLFVTRGGRKLDQWLRAAGMGKAEFAKKAGVSRVTLTQVLSGQRWKYITVDFALKVSIASDGLTSVEDFASVTAVEVSEEDLPPRQLRRATGTEG